MNQMNFIKDKNSQIEAVFLFAWNENNLAISFNSCNG